MAERKRLVLFVEGEGDAKAAPTLINRLLGDLNPWDYLFLDHEPFRIGGLDKLTGPKRANNWTRFLAAASRTRKNLGGILVLLDGDIEKIRSIDGKVVSFCAKHTAIELAERARQVGGGTKFSVAIVIARQEYESWLVAGVASLAGKQLPDGRAGVRKGTTPPAGDLEDSPRDAKRWLGKHMENGYKETLDQALLTEIVDLPAIRQRNMRSFHRLENALREVAEAIRTGRHILSPLAT